MQMEKALTDWGPWMFTSAPSVLWKFFEAENNQFCPASHQRMEIRRSLFIFPHMWKHHKFEMENSLRPSGLDGGRHILPYSIAFRFACWESCPHDVPAQKMLCKYFVLLPLRPSELVNKMNNEQTIADGALVWWRTEPRCRMTMEQKIHNSHSPSSVPCMNYEVWIIRHYSELLCTCLMFCWFHNHELMNVGSESSSLPLNMLVACDIQKN